MACKCFESNAAMLKEHLLKRHGNDVASLEEARWEHSMYMLDGGDHSPVALPFTFRFYKRKKNGELEKRATNGGTNMFMNYCPFCGTKFEGKAA